MKIILFALIISNKKKEVPKCFGTSLLSYLDSNQDKLIQSQMCYRYTIGQFKLKIEN